jgi:hypothetical protein
MSEATNGIMAPKDRSILILYGTETGNAQDIAEDLDQCAQRLRFSTKVEEMNNAQLVSSRVRIELRGPLLTCLRPLRAGCSNIRSSFSSSRRLARGTCHEMHRRCGGSCFERNLPLDAWQGSTLPLLGLVIARIRSTFLFRESSRNDCYQHAHLLVGLTGLPGS